MAGPRSPHFLFPFLPLAPPFIFSARINFHVDALFDPDNVTRVRKLKYGIARGGATFETQILEPRNARFPSVVVFQRAVKRVSEQRLLITRHGNANIPRLTSARITYFSPSPPERELICRGGDWDQVCAGSSSPIITDRSRFVKRGGRRKEKKERKKRVQLERDSDRTFVGGDDRCSVENLSEGREGVPLERKEVTRALEYARLHRGVSKMSRRG